MTFSVSVAQLNFVVGDMTGNARRIIDAAEQAHARGVQPKHSPRCGRGPVAVPSPA